MTRNPSYTYIMYMNISEAWRNLTPIASQQWGHFTTRQALKAGLDRTQLMRMAKDARVEHLATGSYRITGAPEDNWTHMRGEWMHLINTHTTWNGPADGPPPVIISHDTAAMFHELGTVVGLKTEVSVSRRFITSSRSIQIHTNSLSHGEWDWYDGLPVTTVQTTLRDQAAAAQNGDELGRMIYDAAQQGLVDLEHLAQILDPFAPTYGLRTGREMIQVLPAYGGCDITHSFPATKWPTMDEITRPDRHH